MTLTELDLREGFRLSGLTLHALWMRYVAAGGADTPARVRYHVESETCPDEREHDVIAHALDGLWAERGCDHTVRYHHAASPPDSPMWVPDGLASGEDRYRGA